MALLKFKRSAVPDKIPSIADIDLGEIAINTYDGKLYTKKQVGGTQTIVEVGGDASNVDITGGTINGTTIGATTVATGGFTSVSTPTVTNAGTLALTATGANVVAVSTNGSERMRITEAGLVGIGTTAPAYALEVVGDIRTSSGGDLRLGSATGTTTTGGDSQIYNDANDMIFRTGTTTTERFRIGSVGQFGIGGATYGASGQVFSSQGAGAAPTWLTPATGVRSNGQNGVTSSKTLGSADKGTNILILTSGITITFPSTGFGSGEGFAISNVSGGSVTLSTPGGSDFGTTLPNNGTFFAFCDGGGYWRQYCYSTSRL